IVLGSINDPLTRAPIKGMEVRLSFERAKAVLIDALSLPWLLKTSVQGLFGYFNVTPSVRAAKPEDKDKFAMASVVEPDTLSYFEYGRGGAKTLPVKALDLFDRHPVYGKAHLIFDSKKYFTNEKGRFSFPNLDFDPGLVTMVMTPDPVEGDGKYYPIV